MAYLNVPINKISTQRPVRTTGIFYAAACENRLLFPFRKERSCEHWRKSKAIQAYGALRKSFTLSTTFSSRSPLTFSQMAWFVVSLFVVILFGELPPFSLIDGAFLKYFGIPVAFTWFVSQKTFDGKKPFGFLKSCVSFLLRPKVTYAGKAVRLKKETFNPVITTVRSVIYVPD